MAVFDEVAKQVAETIQKEASARAIFGEPVKLDNHIVVPVASIKIELGGGGGGRGVERFVGGGGGGLKVTAKPMGFIHEKDGAVVFTRIPHEEEEKPVHAIPPPGVTERIASVIRGH